MMAYSVNDLMVLSYIILVISYVKAACPQNALDKVQDCTAEVLPNLQQSSKKGPEAYTNHVKVARDTCVNSKLREAADCIQDILDRCKGTTDVEQILQRLIDKEKTLNTVDYFCKHLGVYERHMGCISSHHDEVSLCTETAQKSFQTKIQSGANMDVLITGSCRYHAVARKCLTNTTESYCGKEAATFVFTLLTGVMPPYCDITNPEYRPVDDDTPKDRWTSDTDEDPGDHNMAVNCRASLTFAISLSLVQVLYTMFVRRSGSL